MREESYVPVPPVIRKAMAADAMAIRELILRVRINPMSLDWRRFLVAVDEQDRVIGTGQIKPHADGTREMASIAVQPDRQGEGIGKTIIMHLLAENELPLYLTCQARMEPYYQKFGFYALDKAEMPPYFQRIFRLASFLSGVWPRLGKMCIMVKTS
jgi:N-acetylglutamate synthase-like GNAT family acetyltransferase